MSDTPPASERIESLDLLRGVAAFAVMIPHFLMYYLEQDSVIAEVVSVTAVEVFFVLSGFVLGPQIVLCARRRDWATLRTFLLRRWMRTIPSYLVALLAVSVVLREFGSADFFHYAAYVQNFYSQHISRDYYPVAWSLSVEEWYYVVFPPFLLLYGRLVTRRGEWSEYISAAVLFILCITLLRFVYGPSEDWGANVRRVVVFRIDSIAYGFLLYLLLQQAKFKWNTRLRLGAVVLLAATTTALLDINGRISASDAAWLRQLHPFVSAAFGMSTLLFFLSINSFFQSRWQRAVAAYLGHVSYPIYLFHLVILSVLARGLPPLSERWQFVLYVTAVMLFTTGFHYWFERPILAARPRYPKVEATGVQPIHDPRNVAPQQ